MKLTKSLIALPALAAFALIASGAPAHADYNKLPHEETSQSLAYHNAGFGIFNI